MEMIKIDEILSKVTILKDCSMMSTYIFGGIILGALLAGVGIWWFFSRFWESFAGEKIGEIVLAICGLSAMVFSLWQYFTTPVQIDYYICTNDVAIEQLVEYFDVNELSKVDDSTVCHITPKAEYYDEVLKIRSADKED